MQGLALTSYLHVKQTAPFLPTNNNQISVASCAPEPSIRAYAVYFVAKGCQLALLSYNIYLIVGTVNFVVKSQSLYAIIPDQTQFIWKICVKQSNDAFAVKWS